MPLFLMGLRGAGKSSVGRAAAARLGWDFSDLDDCTAATMGFPTASEALSRRGLAAFRAAELGALESLVRGRGGCGCVVALGGGTPTIGAAPGVIRGAAGALVVYLRAGAGTLRERLRLDGNTRPPLMGEDAVEEVERVLEARDGLYRAVADVVIETDGLTVEAVVDRVVGCVARG